MMTVREAAPVDADALAALNNAYNRLKRNPDQIRQSLRTRSLAETVLVAEEASVVIGFTCFQLLQSVCYDAPWVELCDLYVTPAHRRRGVGLALVQEADRRAEKAGASEFLLRTNEKNREAQALYSQAGLVSAAQVVFTRRYD